MLATGCAVLIIALGVFASSPVLHDQLHTGQHVSLDDGCAVALFAGGVSVAMSVMAPPPVAADWCEFPGVAAEEVLLDSPRYLLQPERGPPVG